MCIRDSSKGGNKAPGSNTMVLVYLVYDCLCMYGSQTTVAGYQQPVACSGLDGGGGGPGRRFWGLFGGIMLIAPHEALSSLCRVG